MKEVDPNSYQAAARTIDQVPTVVEFEELRKLICEAIETGEHDSGGSWAYLDTTKLKAALDKVGIVYK